MEELTVYKTFDGNYFEDQAKADQHEIDYVCAEIDAILMGKGGVLGRYTRTDIYHFIICLADSRDKIKNLVRIMSKIL